MRKIADSELILNEDGSVYHLKLLPDHIADDVIVVGDPGRVERITNRFDAVETRIQNREFITHVGRIGQKRITVLATGIGTDNIDIVLNELDAAVNIDLSSKTEKEEKRSLNIIRMGTSGSLQADVPVDSILVSEAAIGFDGVLHFYDNGNIFDHDMMDAFAQHMNFPSSMALPYIVHGSAQLIDHIADQNTIKGVTITANGFYGPQGRQLRLPIAIPDMNDRMAEFEYNNRRITNYEMETSALYGLGKLLGHNTCTACVIIANRPAGTYSKNHMASESKMIDHVLEKLSES
jgi:uridine phosphorylase